MGIVWGSLRNNPQFPIPLPNWGIAPDKLHHMIAYMGWTVLGTSSRGPGSVTVRVLAVVLIGLLLEWLQRFTPGRSFDLLDFVFNLTGVGLGLGLSWLLGRIALRMGFSGHPG